MTRKTGGPPAGRTDEDSWTPPGSDEPIQRSLDIAIRRDSEEDLDDDECDFIYGDIVHDDEADEPIALVVVNLPGIDAEEWEFDDGETLADRTPKYPNDDDIVIVVPLDVLDEYLPYWDERETPLPIEQLVDDEVPFAPFPSLQLVLVEKSHLRD
ncbi:hypothetical protein [Halobacterium salinarum]|jgi:hypothetical protein|uniref:hypothetical protein n=1 Tax=Halobacterium salinarum TaxID=2242 RepID=UPI003904636F